MTCPKMDLAVLLPWIIVAIMIAKDFLQYREDNRKPLLDELIGFIKVMFSPKKKEEVEDLKEMVDKFKKEQE